MMVRNVITVGLNPAIDYVVRCAEFLPGRVNSGRLVARMVPRRPYVTALAPYRPHNRFQISRLINPADFRVSRTV